MLNLSGVEENNETINGWKIMKYKGHVAQIFAQGLDEWTWDLSDDLKSKWNWIVYGSQVTISRGIWAEFGQNLYPLKGEGSDQ